jgi:hypothetical protein
VRECPEARAITNLAALLTLSFAFASAGALCKRDRTLPLYFDALSFFYNGNGAWPLSIYDALR